MAGIDQGQGIANMEPRDRPRRTAKHITVRLCGGEGNRRTMQFFLQLRSDQPDHAGMPVGIEQTGGEARVEAVEAGLGHVLHIGLQGTTFLIDAVQNRRQLTHLARVIVEQAFDADTHVFQPPCRIDARANGETDVGGGQGGSAPSSHIDQGLQSSAALPGAQSPQASTDQCAVVGVQRHHVGDRAHRHQIQQGSEIGLDIQFGAQCQQQIEHHPDTGQRLAREIAARLVGIDDGIGCREHWPGQMMIGDEHPPAQCLGCGNPGMTGDAMIHRHQQVGFQPDKLCNQARRQSITMHDAIGHRMHDIACAQQAQAAHRDGAGGGTVAIEIPHHQDASIAGNSLGQQRNCRIDAFELRRRQQIRQFRHRAATITAARGMYAAQDLRPVCGPVADRLDEWSANDAARRAHASSARGRRQNRQR